MSTKGKTIKKETYVPPVAEEPKNDLEAVKPEETIPAGDTDGDSDLPPHVLPEENNQKKVESESTLPKFGIVVDCNYLRVREGASLKSKEIHILSAGTNVTIDHKNSTESFYAVDVKLSNNEGYAGFCLKKFIKLGK